MATKAKAPAKKVSKTATKAPAKKATATKPAVKKTAAPAPRAIKQALNKSQLIAHLVEQTGVEAKSVKAVLAGLEGALPVSFDKRAAAKFSCPGRSRSPGQKRWEEL